MLYLLLFSGIFMGWSLGTNDAANVFGTAVSTRVIKYSTAVTLIAVFVIVGAFVGGDGNVANVSKLAIANGVDGSTPLEAGGKAAIILFISALVVFLMSYLKFPVSANQCITGAIIGWGFVYAESMKQNLPEISKFVMTWFVNPVAACAITFALVFLYNKFILPHTTKLSKYDTIVKWGYIISGTYTAYGLGCNSTANVTGLYLGPNNILQNTKLAVVIGACAIALGVLTYSKKVMFTVGNSITELTPTSGFLVVMGTALTIQIFSNKAIGINIPVSTSQAVVGAVIGAGLVNGAKTVDFGVLKRIFLAWFATPTIAGILAYFVALASGPLFGW